jgi:hypothetical protein
LVVLYAFLALLAGFATIVALVMGFTVLLAHLIPSWAGIAGPPKRGYIFLVLGYSYLSTAAGGFVTAWIAAAHPLEHVLMLGIVVLLLSGLSAILSKSQQPTLYQIALVAIMPLGVLAGGIVRLKVLGML